MMDTTWFKAAQRRRGVTSFDLGAAINRDRSVISRIINGHQDMTFEQAQIIAPLLQVDLPTLLEKAGLTDAPTAQPFAPGFADSDVVTYVPKGAEDRHEAEIADLMGQRIGADALRVKSRALELAGYLPGDFVLMDSKAGEKAQPGDVVIAQVYQREGPPRMVLRRYYPPVLTSASADPDEAGVIVVDGINAVIMGKVTASWRLD